MNTFVPFVPPIRFVELLAARRKKHGYTRQQIAVKIHMHASELKRYESVAFLSTVNVFRRFIVALYVSTDMPLREENGLGPKESLTLALIRRSALSPADPKRTTVKSP